MQNLRQTRLIDPILTTFARGWQQNDLVGKILMPPVPVAQSGGQIISFGKEAFMLYDTQRAPGANTRRIDSGYTGSPYATEGHALEALVPDESARDASIVPGIDLAQEAVGAVLDAMLLKLEAQIASKATSAANYAASNKIALAGTALWSASTSVPLPS